MMTASRMFSVFSCVVIVLALTTSGARAEGDDDDHDDDHVYSTFAHCTDLGTAFKSAYTIRSFTAELLMDTHVDTYDDHYNYVAAGTGRGISP